MIKTLIVDDESMGRRALQEKIKSYCPLLHLVGEAENAYDATSKIIALQPDLVFLDIEMPGMDGFEMLNNLKEKKFQVVFTTAYNQHAIRAIKFAAFDYLLKPIDIEELITTVNRLAADHSNFLQQQLIILQENLQPQKSKFKKLTVPTLEGLLFFDIDTILHLEANSNYTNIHFLTGKKVIASKTLKEFEELLPKEIFFRSHHSHIINLTQVKKYFKGDGGQVELSDGSVIEISRKNKEQFLKAIAV